MISMTNTWIVAESEAGLVSCKESLPESCEELGVVVLGSNALAQKASAVAAQVKWIDTNADEAEGYAAAAADALTGAHAQLVIGIARNATRLVFAKAQRSLGASVLSNVASVAVAGDTATITREVYDEYVETDTATLPVMLLKNPFSEGDGFIEGVGDESRIQQIDASVNSGIELVETTTIPGSSLEDAEIVLGVGFGVKSPEALQTIRELATLISAEVGPSMNLAEQTTLMPDSRYIGISGVSIAPRLYLAFGVSGAPQHRAGIHDGGKVAVVNKDPKAKFFNHADYGIVGTVDEIVPALIQALS